LAKRDHIEKYETNETVKVDPKPESTTATTTKSAPVSKPTDRFDLEIKANSTFNPGKRLNVFAYITFIYLVPK
jgi:hypothetical protein